MGHSIKFLWTNVVFLVKSSFRYRKSIPSVILAHAGIQRSFEVLDSGSPPAFARVGRNDDWAALRKPINHLDSSPLEPCHVQPTTPIPQSSYLFAGAGLLCASSSRRIE